jgi:biotin transporter BioY
MDRNKNTEISEEKGIIGSIILVVAGLVILSYFFNIDIKGFLESPTVQTVWSYVKTGADIVWNKFLSGPALFIWNKIIINIVWENILKAVFIVKDWIDLNKSLS